MEKIALQANLVDPRSVADIHNRLLLLLARDFATEKGYQYDFIRNDTGSSTGERKSLVVRTVTLWEMIQSLFYFKEARGLVDDDSTDSKADTKTSTDCNPLVCLARLRSWASGVHLNFTHFIEAKMVISVVTVHDLMDLWCRGAAVQCTPEQPVIDGFFIGYKGDLDAPLDPANFVIIPWKARYEHQAADASVIDSLVCPRIKYLDGSYGRPEKHLVLFMDLATESRFCEGDPRRRLTFGPATPGDETWDGYGEGVEKTSRFCLNIRGYGDSSYAMLKHRTDVMRIRLGCILGPLFTYGLQSKYHYAVKWSARTAAGPFM